MSSTESMLELVALARSGDRPAMAQVITSNGGMIHTIINRLLPGASYDDYQDAYQEACIATIKAARSYDPERNVPWASWLGTCIFRRLSDCVPRDDGVLGHQAIDGTLSYLAWLETIAGPDPTEEARADEAGKAELVGSILGMVARLPERQRRAIQARWGWPDLRPDADPTPIEQAARAAELDRHVLTEQLHLAYQQLRGWIIDMDPGIKL